MPLNDDNDNSSDMSDIIQDDEFTNDAELDADKNEEEDSNNRTVPKLCIDDNEKVIEETKNSNLADAMQKILSASVDANENPILAKRKLNYVEDMKEEAERMKSAKLRKQEKKNIQAIGHVFPDESTAESEKMLKRIATKGTLTLFNAISRAKRSSNHIDKENSKKKKSEEKTTLADKLKETIKESLHNEKEQPAKWSVLDEKMVEKKTDMQNWNMDEEEEDWDKEVDDKAWM